MGEIARRSQTFHFTVEYILSFHFYGHSPKPFILAAVLNLDSLIRMMRNQLIELRGIAVVVFIRFSWNQSNLKRLRCGHLLYIVFRENIKTILLFSQKLKNNHPRYFQRRLFHLKSEFTFTSIYNSLKHTLLSFKINILIFFH